MMCRNHRFLWLAVVASFAVALCPSVYARSARDKLLSAKRVAYDANFQNDQQGLRQAIKEFDSLASDHALGAYALYYAGWTRWSLAASQFQDGRKEEAIATLERSAEDLRKALAASPGNAEFQCALASSLISIAALDPSRRKDLGPEIKPLRSSALKLAPDSPRVIMMDAGMIFWTPAQYGGDQEKGIARWLEAIRRFEDERIEDPILPDWGKALAYGWLANLYLGMNPPRLNDAKIAAEKALTLRPDFWFVKTQVLPNVQTPPQPK